MSQTSIQLLRSLSNRNSDLFALLPPLPLHHTACSTGHQGRHGHEFLEFEYSRGRLRYANNSNYRNDDLIKKEMWVSPLMVEELRRIVEESEIMK